MSEQMTEEEVNKLCADVLMDFNSYYKYSFSYRGNLPAEGLIISVSYGGNHDDIYRYSVEVGKPVKFGKVDDWNFVAIDKDGVEVFSRSNWY